MFSYDYDPEADVLSVEFNSLKYDDAREYGDLIVQISRRGIPVFLILLNASKYFGFLKKRREKSFLETV